MNFLGKEVAYKWFTKEVRDDIITWQLENGRTLDDTVKAYRDIEKYGKAILESDLFAKGFEQSHHKVTTVGGHTLHVVFTALEAAYERQKREESVNIEYVVQACLLHDLGIIGRYEKYANNLICCFRHPVDSGKIINDLFPGTANEVTNAVERHMFPATIIPPTSVTGRILIKADKSASLKETSILRRKEVVLA